MPERNCYQCPGITDRHWICACAQPRLLDPKLVQTWAPVIATVLLEYANVGQIIRMWSEHTAAGQSLWSWAAVFAALATYGVFFRVCLPEQTWARRMNAIGLVMNAVVCGTVIYFRYFHV